jgi:hypothetical protein
MTPREIYRRMVSKIKPADVRLVAACFEDHIGAENAVLMPQLCARTGLHERVVRNILNTLVTEYGIPIGAQSGKAGRWIIADEVERQSVIADLASRVSETNARIRALRGAELVGKVEPSWTAQTLFDEPEVRGYRNSYEER